MKKLFKLGDILTSPFFASGVMYFLLFYDLTTSAGVVVHSNKTAWVLLVFFVFVLGYWPYFIYDIVLSRKNISSKHGKIFLGTGIWFAALILLSAFLIKVDIVSIYFFISILFTDAFLIFYMFFVIVAIYMKLEPNFFATGIVVGFMALTSLTDSDLPLIIAMLLFLAFYAYFVRLYNRATTVNIVLSFALGMAVNIFDNSLASFLHNLVFQH